MWLQSGLRIMMCDIYMWLQSGLCIIMCDIYVAAVRTLYNDVCLLCMLRQLPGQMAAVLKDRNLQHLLLCHHDPVIPYRIQYWLDHVLYQGHHNAM